MKKSKRRWPKIRWTNYHKEFPQTKNSDCWRSWFSFNRYWGGLLWKFNCRHYGLTLDFRRDWIADMVDPSRIAT